MLCAYIMCELHLTDKQVSHVWQLVILVAALVAAVQLVGATMIELVMVSVIVVQILIRYVQVLDFAFYNTKHSD